MTELVAALCNHKEKVILASDRMVTTADESLAFEHGPKFEFVAPNALVLTAGSIHEPELVSDARSQIRTKTPLREIAEILSNNYRQVRQKRVEHEILQEIGITSFEDFQRKQNLLHESIILDLYERIRRYDLGVSLLLAGVDKQAHLYRIGEPGAYRSYDELGFCCIGSGDRHAEPVFAFYGFSPDMEEGQALQIVFEAKKRAEMAGGVGRETDVWIIEKGGIYEITADTISELEGSRSQQENISRLLRSIEIKKTELEYQEA